MSRRRTALLIAVAACALAATVSALHAPLRSASSLLGADVPSYPNCSINAPLHQLAICDPAAAPADRIASLLAVMTVAEKISWLGDASPAIARLGLPAYEWWSEALHGVAFSPGTDFGGEIQAVTSFPEPIGLAASFDRTLIRRVAQTISTEARAMNNAGQAGLTFFTPNINIFRDPRWGRGQETPGEDPYLTSEYVYALISGLQGGADERYLKIVSDCKHFNAYDLEDWGGVDRFHFDARVADIDLVESFLPPFESCVRDARAASVMCSYNAVNGVPSCANDFALQTILREQYDFDGFVVSDCGAIQSILSSHNYTQTNSQTVAAALRAGTDLNCGSFYQDHTQAALDDGSIVEAAIDQALTRSIGTLLRTGWFDPEAMQPYRQLGPDVVNTYESQQLALAAAVSSMVLLQNSADPKRALPWSNSTGVRTLAVIGPLRNATQAMLGNYYGQPAQPIFDFVSAFRSAAWIVNEANGCDVNSNDTSGFEAAVEAAKQSDAIIYIGGITEDIESEGHDRTSIALPGEQSALIRALSAVSIPFTAIFLGGGQVDLSEVKEQVDNILWVGYPGQAGGEALCNVIWGINSTSARLPVTQYPSSYVDQVSMFDMSFRPSATNPGRTYRFYPNTSAVFEFGTGLSYTTFEYVWWSEEDEVRKQAEEEDGRLAEDDEQPKENVETISIASLHRAHQLDRKQSALNYRVNVTNTGGRTSDVVVLLFLLPSASNAQSASDSADSTPSAPLKQLVGFAHVVALEPGATETVWLGVQARQLARVNARGERWLHPGEYHFGVDVPTQTMHTIRLSGLPMRLL